MFVCVCVCVCVCVFIAIFERFQNILSCFEDMSSMPHDGHQSKHIPLKYLLTHLYIGSVTH
jgi:hypothetical protein